MTTTVSGQSVPLAAAGTGRGGGFVGLAWLTWRQHRWMILVCVLGFGLITAYSLWLDHELARLAEPCSRPWVGGHAPASCSTDDYYRYTLQADFALFVPQFLCPLVGMFVAAPLVSREYEQRTNLLVWAQDVRATHWLAVKTTLLATIATVLAGMMGFASSALAHRLDGLRGEGEPVVVAGRYEVAGSRFFNEYFEEMPAMQIGYMLFGFALGLAMGLVARRTVRAMGSTLAVFIATRIMVDSQRHNFMSPIHFFRTGLKQNPVGSAVDDVGLLVGGGYADAAGNPVPLPGKCYSSPITGDSTRREEFFQSCLHDHGIFSEYIDYQPGARLGTFHLIEEAIFVGLAALLFVFVWWRVRRATTVG